jgi:hypothetical protein
LRGVERNDGKGTEDGISNDRSVCRQYAAGAVAAHHGGQEQYDFGEIGREQPRRVGERSSGDLDDPAG